MKHETRNAEWKSSTTSRQDDRGRDEEGQGRHRLGGEEGGGHEAVVAEAVRHTHRQRHRLGGPRGPADGGVGSWRESESQRKGRPACRVFAVFDYYGVVCVRLELSVFVLHVYAPSHQITVGYPLTVTSNQKREEEKMGLVFHAGVSSKTVLQDKRENTVTVYPRLKCYLWPSC